MSWARKLLPFQKRSITGFGNLSVSPTWKLSCARLRNCSVHDLDLEHFLCQTWKFSHFGIIPQPLCYNCDIILVSLGYHIGTTVLLPPFWCHFGNTLVPFWYHIGNTLLMLVPPSYESGGNLVQYSFGTILIPLDTTLVPL